MAKEQTEIENCGNMIILYFYSKSPCNLHKKIRGSNTINNNK